MSEFSDKLSANEMYYHHEFYSLIKFHSEKPTDGSETGRTGSPSGGGVRGQGWEMDANLLAGKQSLYQGFPSVASDRWFARKATVKNVNDAFGATGAVTAPAARRPLNQLQRRRYCLHFQGGMGRGRGVQTGAYGIERLCSRDAQSR